MSESMIERAARAIAAAIDEKWDARDFCETQSGNDPEEVREHCRAIARAVAKAWEEPTPEMVEAGKDAYALKTYAEFTTEDEAALHIWQAMMSRIQNEGNAA